jgi:uncharacterized membrane protein (DUF2068 family)
VQSSTVTVLLTTSVLYCVSEGIEAWGLWHEKRWAEYLTVLATAGFMYFEITAIIDRTTVIRVGALVVNLAILVYLVWNKRLFGLRGGTPAMEQATADNVDWDALLAVAPNAPPSSA